MATCAAKRSDGQPCRAEATKDSQLCYWHDPDSRSRMLEASRKGGSRRVVELPEADLLDPERTRAILAGVIEAALRGALDSATARTVGYLLQIEARIREGHELENRVAELESRFLEDSRCRA